MKPASLTAALVFLAACGPAAPTPEPPSVAIAIPSPPVDPASPESDPRPAVRFAAEPKVEGPEAARDERRYRGTSIPLMVTTIQQMESLFSAMSASSPDRPAVMRRLAESYVELARSARGQKNAERVVPAARAAAIKHFELLHAQHPKYCTGPNATDPQRSTGCDDEVLYYLALEAERAGQLDRARKAYLELLQSHPGSRHVPGAYVAFGEMFLVEAASDPSKLPLAEQSYAEAAKYPDSPVVGFARDRLAEVRAKLQTTP
jgi:hypothetical protein